MPPVPSGFGAQLDSRGVRLPQGAVPAAADRRDLDARALEVLWPQCELGLGSFLVQLLGDRPAAEDVLQETWIVASTAPFGELEHQRAWLYGVARRLALRSLRSDRRRRYYEHRAAPSEAAEYAAASVDALFVAATLRKVLEPEERAMVLLRYSHGFDAAELAEILGITQEATRKRLSRATTRLADAIREIESRSLDTR